MCSALELSNTAVRAAGRAADAQELRGGLFARASAPYDLPVWAPQPASGYILPRVRAVVVFLLDRFEPRGEVQDEPIVRARLHVMSAIVEM